MFCLYGHFSDKVKSTISAEGDLKTFFELAFRKLNVADLEPSKLVSMIQDTQISPETFAFEQFTTRK